MSFQSWVETVGVEIADQAAVANTTTETALAARTVPANFLYPGRRLRIVAFGKLSTTGTPTITFTLRWGGAVSGVLLATTEALTNGSAVSNVNWHIEAFVTCRTIGTSGTAVAFGTCELHTAAGTVLTNVFGVSGYDAPAAATIDTTADKSLALCATWSAASSSNTATCMDFSVEAKT